VAVRQRAVFGDDVTYVVVDREWQVVKPVEAYLEHLRQEHYSPHTVRAYAGGLAQWWSMLEDRELDWQRIEVDDLARFKRRLTNRGTDPAVLELHPNHPPAPSTVNGALTAVLGFYRFQALIADIPAARRFYEHVQGGPGLARQRGASFLGHIPGSQKQRVIGRRRDPKSPPPFLTPTQIQVIKTDAAQCDRESGLWRGDLRMRLFWTLLEESGLRLAEALLLRHGDWHPGTGTTAFLEVRPREDSARRLRVKNQQYRRVYLSDELDDLYGEYLFLLVEKGVDLDDDGAVFVNLFRGNFGQPMRPETIYDWIGGFKRRHPLLPAGWTPHWFRHTHATALLLAGVAEHVVQRRLGHNNIHTLLTTYAHVTEDAAMRSAADWRKLVTRWGATS
jgi:site-specific recombinase XerD